MKQGQLDLLNLFKNYLSKVDLALYKVLPERIEILLQNKQLNIAEIAAEMEFSSRSFFTRYVKKLSRVTPKEYWSGWGNQITRFGATVRIIFTLYIILQFV